jgi:hypothetical protein
MLAATMSATAFAQQSDKPARAAKPDRSAAAAPSTKPAKSAQRKTETPAGQWTLQDALPDHSAAMRYYAPESATGAGLGRVPLRSGPGTFGLATETKTRGDLLPDGRPIPSLSSSSRQPPSFVGLSLSVPTSNKALNIPGVPSAGSW